MNQKQRDLNQAIEDLKILKDLQDKATNHEEYNRFRGRIFAKKQEIIRLDVGCNRKGKDMPEIKLSLDVILEEINIHEATEDNKQMATVIITEIFTERENAENKSDSQS